MHVPLYRINLNSFFFPLIEIWTSAFCLFTISFLVLWAVIISKDGWDPKPLNYTLNKCFSVHNIVKNDIFIVKLDVIRKDWFFYYFKVCLHFVDYLKRKHISNFKSNSFLSMNILIKRFKEIILYFQIQDLLFS